MAITKKLGDLNKGDRFRLQTDARERVVEQKGRIESYCPYIGQNTMGHSKEGGEEVYLNSAEVIPVERNTLYLSEWKAENHKEGYSKCSLNINKDGYVRFTGCDANWWIHCPDANGGNGQSFSLHPGEIVYLKKPE